jgi:hypothetical protein
VTTQLNEIEKDRIREEELALLDELRGFLAHPFVARLEQFAAAKQLALEAQVVSEQDMPESRTVRLRAEIALLKDVSHGRIYLDCHDSHRTQLRQRVFAAARRRAALSEAEGRHRDLGGAGRKQRLV